jgi:mono/diheme cytochrome c family protein
MNFKQAFIALLFITFVACKGYRHLPDPLPNNDWKVQQLSASPQDWSGNPDTGMEYLSQGDYIGSGVPVDFMKKQLGDYQDTVLNRKGTNRMLPYVNMAFETANGTEVISGNCFTCHASRLNGEVIFGLGNAFSDFQNSVKFTAGALNTVMKLKYKKNSPEREAFGDFGNYYKAIAPNIITNNPGLNPAFRLEEACVNHRDPDDLQYRKKENFETIKYTLASDVPPLWNLSKKHAIYYNGMGRGDFAKLLMQASVLGIPDSAYARQTLEKFRDVVAWAASIEPPAYPQFIDKELVAKGHEVFDEHCKKCHGTYGENETYPNKLVSLEVVKTDPFYARYFTTVSGLADWYNNSWYGQSEPLSQLLPSDGYVAPPLDGIWATAPYLHNGSVPTIAALLDSSKRPVYWAKTSDSSNYDYTQVGWKYTTPENGKDKNTYDTTLPGSGNQGHYFGDQLTHSERTALIEYLKTL